MRILILSDIHANWVALQTIQEKFDVCLNLGDLVDYGVEPGPCIDWASHHVTHGVRGNHDHGVAQRVCIKGNGGFRYLTGVTRPINEQLLTPCHRRYLSRLPVTQYLRLGGKRFLMVHASPRDPMDEFAPPCEDFWRKRLDNIDVDYVLVGHTHRPYVLEVDGKTIINPGSVGLPRDGDPRLSYAMLDHGELEMKRLEYPIEDALKVVRKATIPEKAKKLLSELYRTGSLACMPSRQRQLTRPNRAAWHSTAPISSGHTETSI